MLPISYTVYYIPITTGSHASNQSQCSNFGASKAAACIGDYTLAYFCPGKQVSQSYVNWICFGV